MKELKKVKGITLFLVLALFLLMIISIIKVSLFGEISEEKHLLFEISLLFLLAIVAEIAVVRLKQPSVVLLLLLGVFISQSFLSFFWPQLSFIFGLPEEVPSFLKEENLIKMLGQLGAIFIMLRVGLHVKFRNIFNPSNAIVAFLGVFLPFTAGFLYAYLNNSSIQYALFLGASFVATSVSVTVILLKDFDLLKTRVAEVILGSAIIDDVLGLLVLSFVSAYALPSATNITMVLVNALLFFVGGMVVGKYAIKKFLDKQNMNKSNLLFVLCFAFAYAYIAEFIGLSSIVGAFLAGIVLNRSKYRKDISEKTEVLELVFAPIFFISLGMLVDVQAIVDYAIPIVVLTLLAVISKFVGGYAGARLLGLNNLESATVGGGIVPRGEVAFIVALIGLSAGVLTKAEYSIIASLSFLTTFLTPFILKKFMQKLKEEKDAKRHKTVVKR